ncbi:hypothetical protein [Halarcobacter anaerophilus]|uniref:hypothetical protein n=1 Tax=Halarcobacter anaerophilus TaxID=877500 RepID=UPI0005C9F23E|nr:hypothetical protein [Halarcobacter anaerophilus]
MKKLTILLFTASILFAGNLENFLKNDSQELEINKSKDIKEKRLKNQKLKKLKSIKITLLKKLKNQYL